MKKLNFTQTDPSKIEENLIHLIASDWMLVTAGTPEKFNTMTANWGRYGLPLEQKRGVCIRSPRTLHI
jgi:hypothetical protein